MKKFVIHSGNIDIVVELKKRFASNEHRSGIYVIQGQKNAGKTTLLQRVDFILLGRSAGVYECEELIEEIDYEPEKEFWESLQSEFILIDHVGALESRAEDTLKLFCDHIIEAGGTVLLALDISASASFRQYLMERRAPFMTLFPPEMDELQMLVERLLDLTELTYSDKLPKYIAEHCNNNIGEIEAFLYFYKRYAHLKGITYLGNNDISIEKVAEFVLAYDERNMDENEETNSTELLSGSELITQLQDLLKKDLALDDLVRMNMELEEKISKLELGTDSFQIELHYDHWIQWYFQRKIIERKNRERRKINK